MSKDFDLISGLDLPGDLGFQPRGRKSKLTFEVEREVTPVDLEDLSEDRGSKPPSVLKMRERHHALAKAIATGVSEQECAAIYGYSSSRISILKTDVAFKELVIFYRELGNERYVEAKTVMAELHIDASEELRERLETRADDFSNGQLLDLMKATADRTGHGVTTKVEQNVRIGLADRMDAARRRAAEMRVVPSSDVIEGTVDE